MAKYIDAFVIPVAKRNLAAYLRMSKLGARLWREHGALEYRECSGDDLKTPCGVAFPKLAKLKKNEVVFFSWIVYKSRAHRDAVNAKVMTDKRLAAFMDPKKMPFDMNRMTMGGFEMRVDA
ncbi:MAG: DUF1428 domain-containing protein [Planctomycetes bacterium]|nr:DUF1428 domain-containing protein [Planctomycetota bacterium]